ncbi:hypothetical protein C8Q72DRAFT_452590 [Fomitopsis betulina]|nr:hypothetical protein C8Q72DRAFT_452590 [Fomitopsis betulina]
MLVTRGARARRVNSRFYRCTNQCRVRTATTYRCSDLCFSRPYWGAGASKPRPYATALLPVCDGTTGKKLPSPNMQSIITADFRGKAPSDDCTCVRRWRNLCAPPRQMSYKTSRHDGQASCGSVRMLPTKHNTTRSRQMQLSSGADGAKRSTIYPYQSGTTRIESVESHSTTQDSTRSHRSQPCPTFRCRLCLSGLSHAAGAFIRSWLIDCALERQRAGCSFICPSCNV